MSNTTVKLAPNQQIKTGKKRESKGPILFTYLTTFVAGIMGGMLIKEVKKP
jgi:hypothetical protein